MFRFLLFKLSTLCRQLETAGDRGLFLSAGYTIRLNCLSSSVLVSLTLTGLPWGQ